MMASSYFPNFPNMLPFLSNASKLVGSWSRTVGGAQGIFVDNKAGAFWGGADPRRDGYSVGW